jgi:hypothetical protein
MMSAGLQTSGVSASPIRGGCYGSTRNEPLTITWLTRETASTNSPPAWWPGDSPTFRPASHRYLASPQGLSV